FLLFGGHPAYVGEPERRAQVIGCLRVAVAADDCDLASADLLTGGFDLGLSLERKKCAQGLGRFGRAARSLDGLGRELLGGCVARGDSGTAFGESGGAFEASGPECGVDFGYEQRDRIVAPAWRARQRFSERLDEIEPLLGTCLPICRRE